MVEIRCYNSGLDRGGVEDLERRCEVGPKDHVFLFIDTLGDPICRIRNSPQFNILVAELSSEIVGVIRGTIKVVTVKKNPKNPVKVGYILGLRVSPIHRRKGIGSGLVRHMEEWFLSNHVDYAYMATQKDNDASVKLFLTKFGYVKFKTPSILVHPTAQSFLPTSSSDDVVQISKVSIEFAEFLYRNYMGTADFFPVDIDKILRNKLSLGTWVAYFRGDSLGGDGNGNRLPKSWAMLSVWNSGELFKLTVGQQTLSCSLYGTMSKLLNNLIPCLKPAPALPDFSTGPFGFYFVYGVHREGPFSGKLVRELWKFVCNMCRSDGNIKLVVTEVGCCDHNIPHWRLLSCSDDLWCIKPLMNNEEKRQSLHELTNSKGALFVDPREV